MPVSTCLLTYLRTYPLRYKHASYLRTYPLRYKHASGGMRMRVSTLQVPRLPSKVPTRQLLPAFDQQAAAALVIRLAAKQAASGASPNELLTSLDRMLIKVMRALCEYAKGNPASVLLPPQAAQLPGLVFHLRRSPAVSKEVRKQGSKEVRQGGSEEGSK